MSRPRIILSINAGSSSLKITLFQVGEDKTLTGIANASVSGFTAPPATEKYSRGGHSSTKELGGDVKSHNDALEHILNAFLDDKDLPEVSSKDDITTACHRIVHGGDYTCDQLIDDSTYHKIEELEDLAPLHNASAVAIIQSCLSS